MALQISTNIYGFDAPTAYVKIDRVQAEAQMVYPISISVYRDKATREADLNLCVKKQVDISTLSITSPVTFTPTANASGVVTMSSANVILTIAYELLKQVDGFTNGVDC